MRIVSLRLPFRGLTRLLGGARPVPRENRDSGISGLERSSGFSKVAVARMRIRHPRWCGNSTRTSTARRTKHASGPKAIGTCFAEAHLDATIHELK
jgi:hypothetical protein